MDMPTGMAALDILSSGHVPYFNLTEMKTGSNIAIAPST